MLSTAGASFSDVLSTSVVFQFDVVSPLLVVLCSRSSGLSSMDSCVPVLDSQSFSMPEGRAFLLGIDETVSWTLLESFSSMGFIPESALVATLPSASPEYPFSVDSVPE